MVKLINQISDIDWFNVIDTESNVLQYCTKSKQLFYDGKFVHEKASTNLSKISENVLLYTGKVSFLYLLDTKQKYYFDENITFLKIYTEADNSIVNYLGFHNKKFYLVKCNIFTQTCERVGNYEHDSMWFKYCTLINNIVLFSENGLELCTDIKAFDIKASDSALLWTFDTRQLGLEQKINSNSSYFLTTWHNECIFLSAGKQYIFSLDYRTGELLWKYKDERNRYLFFASLETETATLIRNTGGYYTIFDLNERSIIEYERLYDNKEIRKKWGIHGENHIRKGNIRVFIGETMGDEQIFYIVIWDMKENVELYTHRLCDVSVFAGCEMYDNKVYVRIKDVLHIYEVEI